MNWKKDIGIGFIMIIFSIIIFINTLSLKSIDTYYIRVLLVGLILLSIIHIIKNICKREKVDKEKSLPFISTKQLWSIIFIIGYVLMYYIVGFLVASLLFIFLFALMLGYRKIPQLAIITLIITGVVYYIFFEYLKILKISGVLF